MKRRTAKNLRGYLFASFVLFSIVAGFVMSPNNLTTQQTGNGGQSNNKPLAQQTPSYNTPGCVFYDDFSGSSLGSDWVKNPAATTKGATFSTSANPGYLQIHTPSSPGPYDQWTGADEGAYAYVTLSGKIASMSAFTVETKVDFSKIPSTSNSYHLGLMIRFDNNYRMYFWGPYTSTSYVRLEYSGGAPLGYTLPSTPSAYYLRMVRNQSLYYCYVSTGGVSWTYVGSHNPSSVGFGQPTGVGVIVKTWYASPYADVTANFDYFEVSVDAEVDQARYPTSSIYGGQPATILGHMRYYNNKTSIQSGGMGLMVDGSLDQVRPTNSTGWANFNKTFQTSGTHTFRLIAYNNTAYNYFYNSVSNQTFTITWTGYIITVNTVNYDGEPVQAATVRLQFAANDSDVKTPQTTNATGYCRFVGVQYGLSTTYHLRVIQQLYNSTSATYYNETVTLGTSVDHDFTRNIILNTTRLIVHVLDSSTPPRGYQGAKVGLLNGSAVSWPLVAANIVNLTAWTIFNVLVNKDFNLTIYYENNLKTIVTVNSTGVNQNWYNFNSNHKHEYGVKASDQATYPTILEWRISPVTTGYWGESFVFSVWLRNATPPSDPISATKVNCTVGSYSGDLLQNGSLTGNYNTTIRASLIGSVPSGSSSRTFTLTIDAFPQGPAFARPASLVVLITIQAVPLDVSTVSSISVYWSSSAALWVRLSYSNGTRFNAATFSVSLDGSSTSYLFSSIGNGNYTLASPNAFGLPVGAHLFQVSLSKDNYTLVGSQTLSIPFVVNNVPTNPPTATYTSYNELLQVQSGYSSVYWNWLFKFNISYTVASGQPVANASVYIKFFKAGIQVVEAVGNYNSTSGTYFILSNSTSFADAAIYDYTVTASKTGYEPKTISSHVTISWRPVSVEFSSLSYSSLKGLFGGESSTQVQVTLRDQLIGSLLIGADVSYTWAHGSGNFTEISNGVYEATVPASGDVAVGVYDLSISVSSTRYQVTTGSTIVNVDFTGGHVVLPIIGVVPISLFAIVLGAVAVVGSLGGLRAYVWATTPYLVKQINRVLRAVDKGVEAEPIEGLRTRAGTPLSLLLAELESAGISLEKVAVPTAEGAEEEEPEEVELEEVEAEPEKPKRRAEKAKVKPEELEVREPEVKTEDLQFEPKEPELGTEQVEAEVKEPEAKTEKPEVKPEESGEEEDVLKELEELERQEHLDASEKSAEDIEHKTPKDEQTGNDDNPDEGGN